ncbi:MAG: hypothetical protein PHE99_06970, partial [Bacteroidales bacterium]|nr:hypothetical protein [Bacteroidales bacterium]
TSFALLFYTFCIHLYIIISYFPKNFINFTFTRYKKLHPIKIALRAKAPRANGGQGWYLGLKALGEFLFFKK